MREVGGSPAGFMAYTSVGELDGLTQSTNGYGGIQNAQRIVGEHPGTVLQLGLHLGSHSEEIATGKLDGKVDRLLSWIKDADRPVYLRVGYEFDLPENRYAPDPYVRAFRHIVDRAMMRYVERNDVRALCYIDWDWDRIPMFKDQGWVDSRIERDPEILRRWRALIGMPRFVNGDSFLLKSIGFTSRSDIAPPSPPN